MIETNLAQTVNATNDSGSAYDTNVKYLLSDKLYLARMISAQKQTEFFHSDFDNLKKVRSIWICMDNDETEDSIEEIGLDRKTVFGNKKNQYPTDLMKGIIVNIRNGKNDDPSDGIKKSQNVLISMLEELLSEKDAVEKKRILADEYGMIMTAELEGRIQIMCNLSENIIERERIDIIEKMIKANATKKQIISYGFTEEEYKKAESAFYANV